MDKKRPDPPTHTHRVEGVRRGRKRIGYGKNPQRFYDIKIFFRTGSWGLQASVTRYSSPKQPKTSGHLNWEQIGHPCQSYAGNLALQDSVFHIPRLLLTWYHKSLVK